MEMMGTSQKCRMEKRGWESVLQKSKSRQRSLDHRQQHQEMGAKSKMKGNFAETTLSRSLEYYLDIQPSPKFPVQSLVTNWETGRQFDQ
jgi:hypothetical protein